MDDAFVQMFLDEVRVVLRFCYYNVVYVFDVGCSDGMYYIVMEYLDGFDVDRFRVRVI